MNKNCKIKIMIFTSLNIVGTALIAVPTVLATETLDRSSCMTKADLTQEVQKILDEREAKAENEKQSEEQKASEQSRKNFIGHHNN
ncbi:MAG: hypothetical protein JWQ35_244 [Bacteriovoracaceae bacterium]|nr:hypothetical protein [Bacteriovoracaceae bacterium]